MFERGRLDRGTITSANIARNYGGVRARWPPLSRGKSCRKRDEIEGTEEGSGVEENINWQEMWLGSNVLRWSRSRSGPLFPNATFHPSFPSRPLSSPPRCSFPILG